MIDRLRSHLRQHLVAYLALFIALGGTAAALPGRNSVTTNDLVNKAVKTKKLANKAVTTRKLAKSAVKGGQISSGAVSTAKLADDAVTGAKADEQTFQGLVQGDAEVLASSFTADAVGFLPTPLILADIPTMGTIRFIFCGPSGAENQIRVQMLSDDDSQPFLAVSQVTASQSPPGTGRPEFVDMGGFFFSGGGGEPLIARAPANAVFGTIGKWDFQLTRGTGAQAQSAHISVSGYYEPLSTPDQCTVTASTTLHGFG